MENEIRSQWYSDVISKSNRFAESFQLDEMQSANLREFILEVAQEQYKMGNRSGIAWARSAMRAVTE